MVTLKTFLSLAMLNHYLDVAKQILSWFFFLGGGGGKKESCFFLVEGL